MAGDLPEPRPEPALVPGELRGYRQFELRPDGLYPMVLSGCGAWDGHLERAVCAAGADHAPPAADCRCGLYAWYLPGSATVSVGPVSAVVAARGRCILGDRGFRAAEARIEAVALPAAVRWNPAAASRARRMLAESYPRTRVYTSERRMLRDHEPQDLHALGITPPRDRSREYRAAAIGLSVAVPLLTFLLAALPHLGLAQRMQSWWPVLVVLAVAWQAGLVWILTRLMALQTSGNDGSTARGAQG